MEYIHTKERDTFHELSPAAYQSLPPLVRTLLGNKTPKIRITTDMKTGKVINRIIKCRVADLNVYSPSTAFDWRVSVNLEMPYQGEVDEKSGGIGGGKGDGRGGGGERNKDRMSYRCLGGKFTIDLTQVVPFDVSPVAFLFFFFFCSISVGVQVANKGGLVRAPEFKEGA